MAEPPAAFIEAPLCRHYLLPVGPDRLPNMSTTAILERTATRPAVKQAVDARADDKAMLKAAADLTRDLNHADPRIYWADLIGSASLGYGALFTAMFVGGTAFTVVAG